MNLDPLTPDQFVTSGIFRQDEFLEALKAYDWNRHQGRNVLVRGCGDIITPPWAFMAIAARLVGIAKSIRYGNDHDNVVIYRNRPKEEKNAQSNVST